MSTVLHTNERLLPWHPWCQLCGRLKEPGTPCMPTNTSIRFCTRCGRVATAKSAHGIEVLDITQACGNPTS